ncbi:MAG: TolC family protein [Marinilabiliaceae bacterium]|nr:TolC family protein [Marinilabiliaceae bacterium]
MKLQTLVLTILFTLPLSAQTQWTLEECINYGLENNFRVKEAIHNLEAKKINLNTTKKSVLPSVNAYLGQNFDFGRTTRPDNVIVDISQSTSSFDIRAQMSLFEGLRVYHQKASDELNLHAALYDLEQAKENISINITGYFLQVILSNEMFELAKEQQTISEEHLEKVQILVEGGKTSDSDLYAAKATLASDMVNVTKTSNTFTLAKLDLAHLMNYTDVSTFEVVLPTDKEIELMIADKLDLKGTLNSGINFRPGIKAAELRIEKGQRDILVNKSAYFPSLILGASYGTAYYHTLSDTQGNKITPFGTQISDNSREVIYFSLTIPIFNKMRVSDNVKLATVQLDQNRLILEETKLNFVKEIQQAYYNAIASKESFLSAQEAVAATKIAFQYEEIKYLNGASNIYEFNESRLRHQRALSEEIQAKYDYIFRLKILEFYSKE